MPIENFYIDLSILGPSRAGVALYSIEVALYLESRFRCQVIVPEYHAAVFDSPRICKTPLSYKGSIFFRHPLWRRQAGVRGGDHTLFFCPHAHGTFGVGRQVLTVHDLIAYAYPTRNPVEFLYYRTVFPKLVRNAPMILTVSETSKAAICHRFAIPPDRVSVAPNGIDLSEWHAADPVDSFDEEPYLLSVSANRPYKNTIEILGNHDLWSDRYRLKIVSSKARYGRAIRAAVHELGLENRIDFIDDISNAELIRLYKNAAACLSPTLLEGFGRPPLESMAAGRPVLLSDIPVHKEIFGSAGIFITPGDRSSWIQAFEKLGDDAEVQRLIKEGSSLASSLTIENCGRSVESALIRAFPELTELHR